MHPLTRQPTLDSVLSWWSDRNPVGPNINLHAAAKPLMRSASYKYISSSTKSIILMDLQTRVRSENEARAEVNSPVFYLIGELVGSLTTEWRKSRSYRECGTGIILDYHIARSGGNYTAISAAQALCRITISREGAQAAVDANALEHIAELLSSPNPWVQEWMCHILGELARHETTAPAILRAKACQPLVSLLRGQILAVIESATQALYWITISPEGAQAAVDANVLEYMTELLSSPNTSIRTWTYDILGGLACHETTASPAARQLVLIQFSDGNPTVVGNAAQALYQITISPEGAQAAVDANVLECIAVLVSSPNASVRAWMLDILGGLARHETTASPAARRLVSLLHDRNPTVTESAAQALYRITISPEGAQAAVDANVLEYIAELLSSPNNSVRKWMCHILGELAHHETTASAVLSAKPCQPLVSLLRSGNLAVIESAAQVLYRIIILPEGAQATVDANMLEYMAELLLSPNTSIRARMQDILGRLARHETTASTVVKHLISFLRGGNSTAIESAAQALYRITISPEGAQAAVDANVLEYITELLSSPNTLVREWMCHILGELARHETTAPAVLSVKPCQALVSLLRRVSIIGGNLAVIESAVQVLFQITTLPEGAQATMDANVLEYMDELLSSPNTSVRDWTRDMLGELARHKTKASPAVGELVTLLYIHSPFLFDPEDLS
ncbi:armadillo-type protein [Mycena capillaripes]|nr:armadillo-type protein [Mycena capillaripes]